MSNCSDCGSELVMTTPPQSNYVYGKTFRLPLGIKLTIYRDKPEFGCLQCIADRRAERERQIYDAGFNAGVDRVLETELCTHP